MLLKDIYTPEFFNHLGSALGELLPGFTQSAFTSRILTPGWQELELKGRMQHVASVLNHFLPDSFPEAAHCVELLTRRLTEEPWRGAGIEYMFLPEWIHQYGIDYLEESVPLLESVTQLVSCEFAVRPYIIRYEDRMLQQMIRWSEHPGEHVRRLASEGSRPRLPWAMALPALKRDPRPALPILENLKCDPSPYVRRSVANHLNDISKDNPEVVVEIVKRWRNNHPDTDALLRHGCRTLLKAGRPDVLRMFGISQSSALKIDGMKLGSVKVQTGGELTFSFRLVNGGRRATRARIEYFIHYRKKNGTSSKKIFKISERTIAAGEVLVVKRSHSFRKITTKVFYPGLHAVSVVINGRENEAKTFRLV